jgi:hypothetical protein
LRGGCGSDGRQFVGSWHLERRGNGQATFGGPVKLRKQIAVGEKVPLKLTERERDLTMKHTFAGTNLTDRLGIVPSP